MIIRIWRRLTSRWRKQPALTHTILGDGRIVDHADGSITFESQLNKTPEAQRFLAEIQELFAEAQRRNDVYWNDTEDEGRS